jgi:ornithine decarboxylase
MKPRFEISRKIVLEKFDEFRKIADSVSYSSKTNPVVTGILEKERDCFFSIHSINELKNVKDKSRVVFLAQGWDSEELKSLLFEGVRFFVVDNIQDLKILKDYLKRNFIPGVSVFLRLKLRENSIRTEKYFVFGFDSKFINSEIKKLKEFTGIEKVGIHFHRKTQNVSEWDLEKEIEEVIEEDVLKELDYIIFGGGLPSVYANTNVKIFRGIFEKLKVFLEKMNSFGIKVIAEPGRYIAAPAGKLVSHVKAVYENNIVVDVSVYNSDLDALIVPVKLLVDGEVERGTARCILRRDKTSNCGKKGYEPYVIKGVTPCSMDLFRYRVYLKERPNVGDNLIFLNAGAYNFRTDFCDLEKVETEIVD